jgi:hypothetical protein
LKENRLPQRIPALLLLVALLALSGCAPSGREASSSQPPIVATIDGVPVLASEFEDYLAVHFVEDELEEPVPQDDLDRVRSRLFDDFIAQSLLVTEAGKRGVTVDDAEISAWLGDEAEPDPARAAARRVQARRDLAARKLRDAWYRAETKVRISEPRPDTAAENASERLLATLRARHEIVLHTDALPFRYVPERAAGSARR